MKTVKAVALIVICFMTISVFGQSNFINLFRFPEDEQLYDLTELADGSVIAVGRCAEQWYLPETRKGRIWEIEPDGDTLSKTIIYGDTGVYFDYVTQKENGNILIIGKAFVPPTYQVCPLLVAEFTPDLHEVYHKMISTPYGVDHTLKFAQPYGRFYHLYTVIGPYYVNGNLVRIIMDSNMDTVKCQVNNASFSQGLFLLNSVYPSKDSSQLYLFANVTPYGLSATQLLVFDSSFNFIRYKDFPFIWKSGIFVDYSRRITVKFNSDSTFIAGSNHFRTNENENTQFEDVGFSLLDTTLTEVPISYIQNDDTIDCMVDSGPSFDFRDPDSILFVFTRNRIIDWYPEYPSWICAGMLDKNLQPRFLNYYGGDAFYDGCSFAMAKDGGYIIGARRYDWTTQYQEYDIVIMKLNSSGTITSQHPPAICPEGVFSVYPNPATDRVDVYSLLNNVNLQISDTEGSILLSTQLTKGNNSIDITKLSPGVYVFSVQTTGNQIFTKKLIKK